MTTRLISVVMPVYNGERYLASAIDSILAQTYSNFEFIIINDGSTDSTPIMLAEYVERDSRIKLLHQGQNQGVTKALNWGCKLAQGKYIARMDADDLCEPERFERQVKFLENHPEVIVVGCWSAYIDEDDTVIGIWKTPTNPRVIQWRQIFSNNLAHPSVMMRRAEVAQVGFYSTELPIEDFALWSQLSLIYDLANIPEVLQKRRVWKESITVKSRDIQIKSGTTVVAATVAHYLGNPITERLAYILCTLGLKMPPTKSFELMETAYIVENLHQTYTKANSLSPDDAMKIANDAALKLYFLAFQLKQKAPHNAIKLILKGIRISPQSPFNLFVRLGNKLIHKLRLR